MEMRRAMMATTTRSSMRVKAEREGVRCHLGWCMSAAGWIGLYSVVVLLISMSGGLLPLARRVTHRRLQLYLSASAGVMLGAAFFHIIPDAVEFSKENFGWWMSLGVVGLF